MDCYRTTGPAILLLHSIPGWRKTWSSLAPLLAQDFQVFAPDLLGFGGFGDPPGDSHAKGQVTLLLELWIPRSPAL